MTSIIFQTDSYKTSHFLQYPPGTTEVSSYIEARGPANCEILFFGLQMFLKNLRPITASDIEIAEQLYGAHGVPFNKEGWTYILEKHNGVLPIEIRALREGAVVPTGTPLVQLHNTDPNVPWLTSYLETALLRAVWYPTTVASNSRSIKKLIKNFLTITMAEKDVLPTLEYKLHDFGARGVSSSESASIGGIAHLVNFRGSDTVEALIYTNLHYHHTMAGHSVPAAEHSTITAWGKDGETAAYKNMLTAFKDSPIVAVVSDSYNIFNACRNIWGGTLKDRVQNFKGTLVIRPDSGKPVDVLTQVFDILFDEFGYTTNAKGYKVLPKYVRVLQGDGVDYAAIREILDTMLERKICASNIGFGMGGALLQKCDRDTYKFAMKASSIVVNGARHDVFKDPVTDPGKSSKRGKLAVLSGKIPNTYRVQTYNDKAPAGDLLEVVWRDGKLLREQSLDEIRKLADMSL